ncbi:MAG TPA: prepilin-type N-terminal cleavage/methylation domain-containing protein [Candidatus Acidoferrum sp.]|nr:prepilin-type N-terminal cleavage/methylation domain-containing protein [Candidatus Acidoferrum sp.]
MTTRKLLPTSRRGFSLIELMFTVAILAILAALLLPVLQNAQRKAQRTRCTNNLKQIGIAFHAWAHDHQDKFPMEVPMSEHGTREFAQPGVSMVAFKHFQALSNELVETRLLVCPADRTRVAAMSFVDLQNSNLSYLVNTRAVFGKTDSVLAGDRNIRTSGRMDYTFVQFAPGDVVEWSSALHGSRGNVLFADAHVDLVLTANAGNQLTNAGEVLAALPQPDSPIDVAASSQPAEVASSGTPASDVSSPAIVTPSSSPPGIAPIPESPASPNRAAPSGNSAAPPGSPPSGNADAANASANSGQGGGSSKTNPWAPADNAVVNTASNTIARERDVAVVAPRTGVDTIEVAVPAVRAVTNAPASITSTNTNTPASVIVKDAVEEKRDNELITVARKPGKVGSRFNYYLLILLLGILAAIEIVRRRRKRNSRQ